MTIKIFFDGADLKQISHYADDDQICGFTSNPSLMRKAGVVDYLDFVKSAVSLTNKPFSVEVIADDFKEMERQAIKLSNLGSNLYIKIPITNTRGESSIPLIERLSKDGTKVNVTAVFTAAQAINAGQVLTGAPAIISVFAGRIADAGRDPAALCRSLKYQRGVNVELLWASTRELLNIQQAQDCGCDIITISNDLLKKMNLIGKDLTEYSLETVRMFYDDAKASGFSL